MRYLLLLCVVVLVTGCAAKPPVTPPTSLEGMRIEAASTEFRACMIAFYFYSDVIFVSPTIHEICYTAKDAVLTGRSFYWQRYLPNKSTVGSRIKRGNRKTR